MEKSTLLDVDELRTEFNTEDGTVVASNDISLTLKQGETVGLVGESGAGKSVTTRSLLRLIESPGEITNGKIKYDSQDLLNISDIQMQKIRGNKIAYIPQDPLTALNPVLKTGEQIIETIIEHKDTSRKEAREQAIDAMVEVGIPNAAKRVDDYPHEFSGGMRQRVLIAIALSCDPDILIADEPTTALDVTTEAKVLELLTELQEDRELGILLITHDLGVVAQTCDWVNVMYAGNIVEKAPLETLFSDPQHPYTRALIDAIPSISTDDDRLWTLSGSMPDLAQLPDGCNFADRCEHATEECRESGDPPLIEAPNNRSETACLRAEEIDLSTSSDVDDDSEGEAYPKEGKEQQNRMTDNKQPILEVKNLKKHFSVGNGILGGISVSGSDGVIPKLEKEYVRAVDGISFNIHSGETLGLVGESGCGKSTVAESVLQLESPTFGEVYFKGKPLHEFGNRKIRDLRKDMQMVFQDPQGSLNPRKTVGSIIGRAMKKHNIASGQKARKKVRLLLERVGLSAESIDKYPHEFSGGQQQRIAIAHALAVEPELIVCDEPVSALDVSVQAQILNLLSDLQDEFQIAYLFISHNMSVIKHISDRIAVMYLGKIVESGSTDDVFSPPYHPYTESLLSAVPEADPTSELERILLDGTVPSPRNPPDGCSFHTRCPKKMGDECENVQPKLESKLTENTDHEIACHLSTEDMYNQELDNR